VKGKLFWKIFGVFCGVTFVQSMVLWGIFLLFSPAVPVWMASLTAYAAPAYESLGAAVVAKGGPAALESVTLVGPNAPLQIGLAEEPAMVGGRVVHDPNGKRWRVVYHPPTRYTHELPHPPAIVYISGIISGLLMAAILAAYMARPVRALREGFEAFARGRLDVRLGPKMGRRRDEISDLAMDFDGMATKIEQLVRSRMQLIDDMSHEVRSPLARLQLAIALARQKPESAVAALDRIEQEARRLDEMAGSLLTLSRLEGQGNPPLDRYFDLGALIKEIVADTAFESAPKGLRIDLKNTFPPAQSRITLAGDAELIRRALENVLRNAMRFSPTGGTITIAVGQDQDRAIITIADQGPGMTPAELPSVFEPFVRGQGETGGFGLGLAIAQRAVCLHGGTIRATNRATCGFRVSVELPCNRPKLGEY